MSSAAVLAIALMATSCFLDPRSDAEKLDGHVRAMAGVADTDMRYDRNFTSGENFNLAVTQRFGRPVAVTVRTGDGPTEFIVGGCYRHTPEHVRLPLEIELSTEFEKC